MQDQETKVNEIRPFSISIACLKETMIDPPMFLQPKIALLHQPAD
jgi:hypothetical protein